MEDLSEHQDKQGMHMIESGKRLQLMRSIHKVTKKEQNESIDEPISPLPATPQHEAATQGQERHMLSHIKSLLSESPMHEQSIQELIKSSSRSLKGVGFGLMSKHPIFQVKEKYESPSRRQSVVPELTG